MRLVVAINNLPNIIFEHALMFTIYRGFPIGFVGSCHCLFIPQHLQFVRTVHATANTHANTSIFLFLQQFTESKIIISFGHCKCGFTHLFNDTCWGFANLARCHHCMFSRSKPFLWFFVVTNWLVFLYFLIFVGFSATTRVSSGLCPIPSKIPSPTSMNCNTPCGTFDQFPTLIEPHTIMSNTHPVHF